MARRQKGDRKSNGQNGHLNPLSELEAAWERDGSRAITTIREFAPEAFLALIAAAVADEDE